MLSQTSLALVLPCASLFRPDLFCAFDDFLVGEEDELWYLRKEKSFSSVFSGVGATAFVAWFLVGGLFLVVLCCCFLRRKWCLLGEVLFGVRGGCWWSAFWLASCSPFLLKIVEAMIPFRPLCFWLLADFGCWCSVAGAT